MSKKISAIAFFVILVILPLLTFILPKKDFSEAENKKLAEFPKVSVDNIMDKKFMDGFDRFVSDHFVFREDWIKAKTTMELATGQKEINSVFPLDSMIVENIGKKDNDIYKKNYKVINDYAKKYGEQMSVNVMLIPTASEIYKDQLPKYAPVMDQTKYISQFYSKLQGVNTIDVIPTLTANRDSYIYYRTDHHWTSYGAYLGYTALGKSLGYKPLTHNMFNIELGSNKFLGTLYSKVLVGEDLKDSIDLYHYSEGSPVEAVVVDEGVKTTSYDSIFFKENLGTKDKYSVFLGKNQPIVTIKTKVKNGQKLLMFKDSYSHTLMQFLPLHYEEITLVDLRYISADIRKYIDIENYTSTLFIYNMAAFVQDKSLNTLRLSLND